MSTPGTDKGTKLEQFFTPYNLAWAITQRVFHSLDRNSMSAQSIIEPSVGGGAFAEAILLSGRTNIELVVNDIDPELPARFVEVYPSVMAKCSDWGSDDPTWNGVAGSDLVLGNPPFTQAELHVRKGLERANVVAFLLQCSYEGMPRLAEHLIKYPIWYKAAIGPRPSFTGGKTAASEYALFIHVRGFTGEGTLGRPILWEK